MPASQKAERFWNNLNHPKQNESKKSSNYLSEYIAAHRPAATPVPTAMPTAATDNSGVTVPIVFYHYPPADFEQQLTHLEQNGYTVVNLDAVVAGLSGQLSLPAKPVVITFDDGFSNQWQAYEILARHKMTATYYIITGGEASGWCIGAGRNNHPHADCGDSYLNWDQIRALDRSGVITIGGHTANHPCNQNEVNYSLVSADTNQLRTEIIDSKATIERELGHSIMHFSYPCGVYNQSTVDYLRAAGYNTATTIESGTWQPAGSQYILKRVRTTLDL